VEPVGHVEGQRDNRGDHERGHDRSPVRHARLTSAAPDGPIPRRSSAPTTGRTVRRLPDGPAGETLNQRDGPTRTSPNADCAALVPPSMT
jgi:hypothetical protein